MKYIYIPIEIKNREYLAKILLGLYLAKNGYTVIIGQSTVVDKICLIGPRGVYMGTSIVKQHRLIFEKLKKRGHHVIAADEEGLVYYNEKNFVANRIDEITIRELDCFMLWGEHHKSLVLGKCPQLEKKIKIAGNVRMEILKEKYHFLYKEESDAIKNEYGKFILMNTNFAAYNHFDSPEKYMESVQSLIDAGKEDIEFVQAKIQHQKTVMDKFADLALELRRIFPEYKVVIRPHPSENISTWQNKFQGINGVEVVHRGSVIPWIIASEMVIQQNCTTGIEALCMGKKVFAYLPQYDERFDSGLPNHVTPVIRDKDTLIKKMSEIINGAGYGGIQEEFVKKSIDNYIGNLADEKNTFEEYKKIIDNVAVETVCNEKWSLRAMLLYAIDNTSMALNAKKRKNISYIRQKFNSLDEQEILHIEQQSDEHLDTDYCKTVNVLKIYNNLFVLREAY